MRPSVFAPAIPPGAATFQRWISTTIIGFTIGCCHTTIYKPWTALRGDMVVEIADQTYVLTCFHGLNISITSSVSDPLHSSPEYRIEGRGNEARIMPIHKGIRSSDFSLDKESADASASVKPPICMPMRVR